MMHSQTKANVRQLSSMVGLSRQGYYKQQAERCQRDHVEAIVVELMTELRQIHPKMGCGKIQLLINERLGAMGLESIGRDQCYAMMREHGLALRRTRRTRRTTDSRHSLRKYPDIYNGRELTGCNQAWVADITYWQVRPSEFLYLHLVTDAYSRTILGWALSPTLQACYTIEALEMALRTLDESVKDSLIHHSDRGIQYCSDLYVKKLKQYGIGISMTQSGDPRDNAKAERINGIIKNEYLAFTCSKTFEESQVAVRQSVELYNTIRPHRSLNNQTPMSVHSGTATRPIVQLWKRPTYKPNMAQQPIQQTNAEAQQLPTDNLFQEQTTPVNLRQE